MKKFSDTVGIRKDVHYVRPDFNKMYKHLVEHVQSGVFIADEFGVLFYVNPVIVDMLGFNTRGQILERVLTDILYSDEAAGKEFYDEMEELGFLRDYEIEYKRPDGILIRLSVTARFIRPDGGKIKGIEGFVLDRTAELEAKAALVREKMKLEEILNLGEQINFIRSQEDLVEFIVDKSAQILEAQRCSVMLVNEEENAMTIAGSRGLEEQIAAETVIAFGAPLAGMVAQERRAILVKNIEYDERFKRANRNHYASRSFMIAPILLGDQLFGVINVTDKKGSGPGEPSFDDSDLSILNAISREAARAIDNIQLLTRLNLQTVTDPLTRIYNYRKFSDSLAQEINRWRRHHGHLCVVMLDLDDFKSYNDTYGHPEGDKLLQGIGQILRHNLRDTDVVCRYAGDEFSLVLPDTNEEGFQYLAGKIVTAVSAYPFKRRVTMSMGGANYEEGMTQEQFIAKADQALYKAKQQGKNCWHYAA